MKALELYRAWDEGRWLKWADWWERKRAGGRSQYVRWVTFFWGGGMINISVLWEVFSSGAFDFERFLISVPLSLAGGWFVGAAGWASNERRYKKYLASGRNQQLHGGRNQQLKQ